jgi:hypothetical protein
VDSFPLYIPYKRIVYNLKKKILKVFRENPPHPPQKRKWLIKSDGYWWTVSKKTLHSVEAQPSTAHYYQYMSNIELSNDSNYIVF